MPENDPTRLERLVQRIEPVAAWADLALPEPEVKTLRDLAANTSQRLPTQAEPRSRGGAGVIALFAGPSGTGKTMAAEALARDLNLGLYRVDLTAVVSKYIGETEKNLSRVFAGVSESGAILFFDEADALFAKHSDVKDGHDRYSNIEVNYFLRQADAFHGLIILAGDTSPTWSPELHSRIRFVVNFPPPDTL